MKTKIIASYLLMLLLIILNSCHGCMRMKMKPMEHHGPMMMLKKAVAVLHPTGGNSVSGIVTFTKEANGIRVVADIKGLTPGVHGFHIHDYGDCSSADGNSAGGHFNPMEMPHSAPTSEKRHIGDLGNITADDSGNAKLDWLDTHISFEGHHSIIGRSVIVHASPDDLTSQPTGAAGARVACGVIGVAKE
jgi:Cu-Zn family superoxide dismutase